MLRNIFASIAYVSLYICIGGQGNQGIAAQNDLTGKKTQFLIIEFVNANNVEGYAGLTKTIPITLEESLQKIGSVEILPLRMTGHGRSGKNPIDFDDADLVTDKHAISGGKTENSDIVILGIYYIPSDNPGEQIKLKAKAIDIRTGEQIALREKTGFLSADISPLIHEFSTELAQDVTEAVEKESPPLWRDELTKKTSQGDSLSVHIAPFSSISLKNYEYYSQYEIGGRIDINRRLAYKWIYPLLSVGSASAQTKTPVSCLFFYFAQGGLTYPIAWHKFIFSPFLLGGVHGGKVASNNTEINFLLPSVESGLKTDYFLNKTIGLSLSASYVLLLDSNLPVSVLRLSLGIALRL